MQEEYNIYLCDKIVGKAKVVPQGLYYCISCYCTLDHDQMYELMIVSEKFKYNLGVVIPERNGFSLTKRIPAKRITDDNFSFIVAARSGTDMHTFISVDEEKAFPCMDQLEHAVMANNAGVIGVCFFNNDYSESKAGNYPPIVR